MYYEFSLIDSRGFWGDRLVAILLISLLLPLWFINCVIAWLRSEPLFHDNTHYDAIGRLHFGRVFSNGLLRNSFLLWDVAQGTLKLLGLSRAHRIDRDECFTKELDYEFRHQSAGIFSVYDLHAWVGLVEQSHVQVLRRQLSLSHSSITYYAMLGQVICGWILFGCIRLREAARINLFGVVIHNDTLADALNWFSQSAGNGCRTAFFINVNSLNIAYKSPEFRAVLNAADKLFADGSGVRLGAMRSGNRLRANINGTDLLPHLCEQCVASSRSIFLLGAEPGVVDIAADKLKKQHSGLQIAGVHHGYFDISQSAKMIERINQSGATFLLVGFGSPLQENWVLKNVAALRCDYVLAVGGLFDFVAGKFSRAPLWLRGIGMEWIWRLLQDPATKFSRYVLGNPLFIYRLLFKLHQ